MNCFCTLLFAKLCQTITQWISI